MADLLSIIQELRIQLVQITDRLLQVEAELLGPPEAKTTSVKGPFYDLAPSDGLHVLRKHWGQKSYIGPQCKKLKEGLIDAIAATRAVAPKRSSMQTYRLQGDPNRTNAEEIQVGERRLESQMWAKWGPTKSDRSCDVWHSLVACQIPLYDSLAKDGWGHIDLLGIDKRELIVIELKEENSREPPILPLMQAACYAIALQENWLNFLPEIESVLDGYGIELIDFDPNDIRLMILAPTMYWQQWTPGTVSEAAWRDYANLVGEFSKLGFKVRFSEICNDDPDNPSVKLVKQFQSQY